MKVARGTGSAAAAPSTPARDRRARAQRLRRVSRFVMAFGGWVVGGGGVEAYLGNGDVVRGSWVLVIYHGLNCNG